MKPLREQLITALIGFLLICSPSKVAHAQNWYDSPEGAPQTFEELKKNNWNGCPWALSLENRFRTFVEQYTDLIIFRGRARDNEQFIRISNEPLIRRTRPSVYTFSFMVLGDFNNIHKSFSTAIRNYFQLTLGNKFKNKLQYRDYRDLSILGSPAEEPNIYGNFLNVLDSARLDLLQIPEVRSFMEQGHGFVRDINTWTSLGEGTDIFEATLAARSGIKRSYREHQAAFKPGKAPPWKVRIFKFAEEAPYIEAELVAAETKSRQHLLSVLPAKMMDHVLTLDACEMIRKLKVTEQGPNARIDALIKKTREVFKVELSEPDAVAMLHYVDTILQNLSPPLGKEPEKPIEFVNSHEYVIGLDFTGVGSINLRAMMEAAMHIEKLGLRRTMDLGLEKYSEATKTLKERQKEVDDCIYSIEGFPLLGSGATFTGDDGAILLTARPTPLMMTQLAGCLGGTPVPNAVRMTATPIAGLDEIAIQGRLEKAEIFEKTIRAKLFTDEFRDFSGRLNVFIERVVNFKPSDPTLTFQVLVSFHGKAPTQAQRAEVKKAYQAALDQAQDVEGVDLRAPEIIWRKATGIQPHSRPKTEAHR